MFDPPIDESDALKEMFKCDPANMSMVESNEFDKQLIREPNKVIKIDSWDQYEDKTVAELVASVQMSLLTDGEGSSVTNRTPTSKRSQDDKYEVPELTSTSKRFCSKSVKIEK
ncbi:Uncharacterized protein Rs2_18872 [Raphanus sativus]|nr:Uncharacterized protein Rs2_18872 [Raphanus sativus]